MTATSCWMKAVDVEGVARRPGAAQGEWSGIGWTDSSWELMRGLDVAEDLPLDVWPAELPPPAHQPARAERKS